MSLTDFTDKIDEIKVQSLEQTEIYKYIQDKRILRGLFDNRIFTLRKIQKEAIIGKKVF